MLMNTRRCRKEPPAARRAAKVAGGAQCHQCGLAADQGRWTWEPRPRPTLRILCPACRCVQEREPAGLMELRGDYFRLHWSEILNLVRHVEEQECARHPLERIVAIEDTRDGVRVATTGVHLARRLGRAVSSAHHGDLSLHYGHDEQTIRLYWRR